MVNYMVKLIVTCFLTGFALGVGLVLALWLFRPIIRIQRQETP